MFDIYGNGLIDLVLIQGIKDPFFNNNNGYNIINYKLDRALANVKFFGQSIDSSMMKHFPPQKQSEIYLLLYRLS